MAFGVMAFGVVAFGVVAFGVAAFGVAAFVAFDGALATLGAVAASGGVRGPSAALRLDERAAFRTAGLPDFAGLARVVTRGEDRSAPG